MTHTLKKKRKQRKKNEKASESTTKLKVSSASKSNPLYPAPMIGEKLKLTIRGSFSTVRKGRVRATGQKVAIKIMSK